MRQLIQCHAMQGSYDLQDVKEGMQAEVIKGLLTLTKCIFNSKLLH